MKNNLIIEYKDKDAYEHITNIFDTTKDMARVLGKTPHHCREIISCKHSHKGYRYERVWLNREY